MVEIIQSLPKKVKKFFPYFVGETQDAIKLFRNSDYTMVIVGWSSLVANRDTIVLWCEEKLKDDWIWCGWSLGSSSFYFLKPEDATLFKLRFGF